MFSPSKLAGGPQAALPILMYHRVLEHPDPLQGEIHLAGVMDTQFRTLRQFFNVLPLDEADVVRMVGVGLLQLLLIVVNRLEALLAILGCMTMQGPITQWVTDHRKHHALSDKPGDPHSPHVGHGEGLGCGEIVRQGARRAAPAGVRAAHQEQAGR